MNLGAIKNSSSTHFRVWAPLSQSIALHVVSPEDRFFPMEKDEDGCWNLSLDNALPVSDYMYRIDNDRDRPDPVSFFQPQGVHGPSRLVDHDSFAWTDQDWKGIPLEKMIFYEVHPGTFTQEGTFEGLISRLSDLMALGINAIELMPVAQFPGQRNWGYDGVYPFAVQDSYGGPEGLKKLADACHANGMALVLDVVYNHLGPEGNYIWDFAPYFTDRYKTGWGWALNFDGAYSNGVRHYFISNALYWFEKFHIDALRLDAVHGIFDFSACHILEEMAAKTAEFSRRKGREFYLIAESDLNDSRIIRDHQEHGYDLSAQWNDDFHHCLHTLITGEGSGYYEDFGSLRILEKCLNENYAYSGQYSVSRKRNHGNSAAGILGNKFVVFSQNHDQTGNRMRGERLPLLTDFNGLKLAAGMTLLSPFIPFLFMGEEYGEESPFLYFISHSDSALIEAVRKGRKKEFESFGWQNEPPDPYSVSTFEQCILKWTGRQNHHHGVLLNFYRELIVLRKTISVLSNYSKASIKTALREDQNIISIHRFEKGSELFILAHFSSSSDTGEVVLPEGNWASRIDSYEPCWLGKGQSISRKNANTFQFEFNGFGFVLLEKR